MKTNITRSLILLTLIIGVLYGCKKTDKVSIKQDDGIAQIKEKYKNLPLSQIQILNIPGKGYYGDINGHPIITPVYQNGALGTSLPGSWRFGIFSNICINGNESLLVMLVTDL